METAGSSPSDVDGIRNGIHAAADGLNVDKRVILGIIIEESSGYVGVPAPSNMDGVPTAGLMQALGCPGFPGRTNLSQVSEVGGVGVSRRQAAWPNGPFSENVWLKAMQEEGEIYPKGKGGGGEERTTAESSREYSKRSPI